MGISVLQCPMARAIFNLVRAPESLCHFSKERASHFLLLVKSHLRNSNVDSLREEDLGKCSSQLI